MLVPYLDMSGVNESVYEEFETDLKEIIATGQFTLGAFVQRFEEGFAKFIGQKFCVGVGSGSDALMMALRTLGVSAEDEVIVPAFGYASTAEAVARVGATPVFVDVRPESYTLDPDKTLASITSRTKAIIPSHTFGHAAEIDRLVTVARTYSVSVIEDCRASAGARNGHRRLGTYGDVAVFSFHPSTPLGAMGDGGAITTNDEQKAAHVRKLRDHGRSVTGGQHEMIGCYSLLDAVHAALLFHKMKDLDENNAECIENARLYTQLFRGTTVLTPPLHDDGSFIYSSFVVRVPEREKLVAHLKEKGIGHAIPADCPVHMQPCFRGLNYQKGAFPIAEELCERALALPNSPGLKKRQVEEAANIVLEFYGART